MKEGNPCGRVDCRKSVMEPNLKRLETVSAVCLQMAFKLLKADTLALAYDLAHGLHDIQRHARVLVSWPQPDCTHPTRLIDAMHDLNLQRFLVQINLIDANGISPNRPLLARQPQLPKGMEKARGDPEISAMAGDLLRCLGIAPYVRKRFKVWLCRQRDDAQRNDDWISGRPGVNIQEPNVVWLLQALVLVGLRARHGDAPTS